MATYSSDQQFVELMRPILETGDFELLARHIRREWPNSALRELLFCENEDAVKVALFCLSLTGTMEDCPAIACLLRHNDRFIVNLAENTLWSIWFRAGGDQANCGLRQAVRMMGETRLEEARVLLSRLIHRYPDFAEAYNQRAIVHFLQGNYSKARRDLLEVLRRNPVHYAALAGLGHCYAASGRWEKALAWYERTARVHPGAEGLREAISELNRLIAESRRPDCDRQSQVL
ncbi:MAG TPA: tetratricopeptide repeat protein [Phycisphaerae bacterium]|nr:tetratricopeptide repeat protein [Phycisphaerae bacterium]HOJ73014.1 tetratricopeptide repeat protein [Phycisphaerae bacterium]HOM50198.1 tetratricopeptide repeat protein [Phycisphaerae bacterium]HON67845.1 tetratricopeptide repeat protein [Phycisphaerae bacterium]HOQ87735.1 tetratricopeptide repeat protein [Phycisphaerae bacterium]